MDLLQQDCTEAMQQAQIVQLHDLLSEHVLADLIGYLGLETFNQVENDLLWAGTGGGGLFTRLYV